MRPAFTTCAYSRHSPHCAGGMWNLETKSSNILRRMSETSSCRAEAESQRNIISAGFVCSWLRLRTDLTGKCVDIRQLHPSIGCVCEMLLHILNLKVIRRLNRTDLQRCSTPQNAVRCKQLMSTHEGGPDCNPTVQLSSALVHFLFTL